MRNSRGGILLFLLGLTLVVSSCVTGAKLSKDAKLIEQQVATARERGAYRCAPAQLARAEANLEFLLYEIDEGDFRRADWHQRKASENITEALAITDPNECAEKRIVIAGHPFFNGNIYKKNQYPIRLSFLLLKKSNSHNYIKDATIFCQASGFLTQDDFVS